MEPVRPFNRELEAESIEEVLELLKGLLIQWRASRSFISQVDMRALRKAAEFCVKHELNPTVYFQAHTEQERPDKFISNFLCTKNSLNIYNNYKLRKFGRSNYGEIYHLYAERLRTMIVDGNYTSETLLSDEHLFPAWFRIIMPIELDPRVAAKYGREAKLQFKFEEGLQDFINSDPLLSKHVERLK